MLIWPIQHVVIAMSTRGFLEQEKQEGGEGEGSPPDAFIFIQQMFSFCAIFLYFCDLYSMLNEEIA